MYKVTVTYDKSVSGTPPLIIKFADHDRPRMTDWLNRIMERPGNRKIVLTKPDGTARQIYPKEF